MPILCFHPFISAFLSIHAMSNLEIILTWKDKGNAKLKEEETRPSDMFQAAPIIF